MNSKHVGDLSSPHRQACVIIYHEHISATITHSLIHPTQAWKMYIYNNLHRLFAYIKKETRVDDCYLLKKLQ